MAVKAWPTKVFAAADYGCTGGFFKGRTGKAAGGRDGSVGLDCADNGIPYNCPKNCSGAVQAAIDAAGAAGGGVVKLGLGRWYLDGPLLLPDSVALKGAGMDRTAAVYFAFRNASNTPGTMIGAVHGTRPGDAMYPGSGMRQRETYRGFRGLT